MKEKPRSIKGKIPKTKAELTASVGIYLDPVTYKRIKDMSAIKYIPMAGVARQTLGEAIDKIAKFKGIV